MSNPTPTTEQKGTPKEKPRSLLSILVLLIVLLAIFYCLLYVTGNTIVSHSVPCEGDSRCFDEEGKRNTGSNATSTATSTDAIEHELDTTDIDSFEEDMKKLDAEIDATFKGE